MVVSTTEVLDVVGTLGTHTFTFTEIMAVQTAPTSSRSRWRAPPLPRSWPHWSAAEATMIRATRKITFPASDICDAAPTVSAVLVVPGASDIPVSNGQIISFERDDDDTEIELEDGILEIEAQRPDPEGHRDRRESKHLRRRCRSGRLGRRLAIR